jgi:AmmeMemoRadiSam system protein B
MIRIRAPAVAGTFYNLDKEMLKKQIERCFAHKLGPKEIRQQSFTAAIVPHAGYEYSGPTAAWVYSKIEKANYVILGPNHTGLGARFALMKVGMWKTPLGEVIIDQEFAEKLLECKLLEFDVMAHENEHSIEVQLPFLQYRFGDDFKFVPISILNEFADETLLEACRVIGKGIASTIKKRKEKWIIIASSDFSHYVPQERATKTDKYVIKAILDLNEKDFFARINEKDASVCGFGPIAIAIVAAKELGAKKGELLKYSTSGDITGDLGAVVGYASIMLK